METEGSRLGVASVPWLMLGYTAYSVDPDPVWGVPIHTSVVTARSYWF